MWSFGVSFSFCFQSMFMIISGYLILHRWDTAIDHETARRHDCRCEKWSCSHLPGNRRPITNVSIAIFMHWASKETYPFDNLLLELSLIVLIIEPTVKISKRLLVASKEKNAVISALSAVSNPVKAEISQGATLIFVKFPAGDSASANSKTRENICDILSCTFWTRRSCVLTHCVLIANG